MSRAHWIIAATTLAVAAPLLFARLGHYALWDDEAITALTALGVWETADTSAVHGHNILLYRNGLLLRDYRDRGTPPLQFYVAAPFLGLGGRTALAARLPFALAGLACTALILWWLRRDNADTLTWLLVALTVVTNVSLILYFRQCRYYGITTLLAVAAAYTYLHVTSRRGLIAFSILMLLLLASNYMTFAAASAALVIDYAIWGRKRRWLSLGEWAMVVTPVILLGGLIVFVWNPLRIAEPADPASSWLADRLTLLWWNIRDIVACEYAPGALLVLAAPPLFFVRRDPWLLRAPLALLVCILTITIVSPQAPGATPVADVRYLSWVIPLCIAVAVLSLRQLARWSRWMALAIALVACGSNLLNGTPLWSGKLRSTPYLYVKELLNPPPEPITPVARWINDNVREGASVWALPSYMTYPLMFHAPNALYAWQLDPPLPKQYEKIAPVHVRGWLPPDYIVAFGPLAAEELRHATFETSGPVRYQVVQVFDVFWKDLFRPELFWRRFEPIRGFDPNTHGVTILRRSFD